MLKSGRERSNSDNPQERLPLFPTMDDDKKSRYHLTLMQEMITRVKHLSVNEKPLSESKIIAVPEESRIYIKSALPEFMAVSVLLSRDRNSVLLIMSQSTNVFLFSLRSLKSIAIGLVVGRT